MKKILFSLVAFTVITLSAGAQVQREQKDKMGHDKMGEGPGGRHHGKMMQHKKMMMQKLNFTDQQKQQMKDMQQEFKTKDEQLNKNDGITVKEFREKKKSLMEDRKVRMQSILTPEQKSQMEKFQKQAKERQNMMKDGKDKPDFNKDGKPDFNKDGKERMNRQGQNIEKMKTDLGLTNDQATKIQANRESFRTKAQAIRDNQALSQDQKKEQFKALNEDMKKEMKSILTAEQLKKMEENRGKKPQ